MLNEIPDYQSLTDFSCLSEQEEKQVCAAFRKLMGVDDENDAVMGDAEAKTGQGQSVPPAEEEAEVISDDEDAAEYSAQSGRDQLLDALGNLYTLSEELTVCLFCGSTEHDHLQCNDPKSAEVKKVLRQVRESLTEQDEDVEMEQEQQDEPEKNDDAPKDQPEKAKEQQGTTRVGEYHWYEDIVPMPEVGDLDEGGCFCIEGRRIDFEGPKSKTELNNVVDDAVMRGGGDTWKVKDFMEAYPEKHSHDDVSKDQGTRRRFPQDRPHHRMLLSSLFHLQWC